jgi:signal transduction histidine kinase
VTITVGKQKSLWNARAQVLSRTAFGGCNVVQDASLVRSELTGEAVTPQMHRPRMAVIRRLGGRPIPGLARVREVLRREHTVGGRYGAAVASTAFALLGAFALEPLHVHTNLLFVAAVAISAWYGGRGPGLVASVLAVTTIAFSRQTLAPAPPGVGEAVYLATFLFVALIIGATTESLRFARAQAIARAELLEELNIEVEQQMEEVQTLSESLQASNDSLSEALSAAEDMASHAMRLQDVTAALSQARTESEVADVVLGKGLGAIDGARGVLARVDDGHFAVIRTNGYEPEIEARLLAMSLDDDTPLTRVVKSGEPLWLRSPDEHRALFSRIYDRLGLATATPASVAVPLRHGDEIVGALEMVFAESSAFGAAKQAFSLLLAQAAGDALVRARSYDAERIARRGAETLAQARADVLGIVAHDLRNPLSVIASGSGLLLDVDDLPAAQRRKMLEIMRRSVRQMNRLIADLLDATRLQAGRLTLDLSDIDARAIVREAEETLRPTAAERRIELQCQPPENECFVRVDEGRLLQVLGNLIGNALKFTPAGGHVTLSARPTGVEVVFSVADDGPGIPPEHQTRLFDGFWQARDGDRRGVGLGLTITKGIIDAHGGRIWVESAVGVGSTFSFALPADVDGTSNHRSAADAVTVFARDATEEVA